MEASLPATDGRMPGRRGQATRRKLLDTTTGLLGTTSYRRGYDATVFRPKIDAGLGWFLLFICWLDGMFWTAFLLRLLGFWCRRSETRSEDRG